MEDDEVALDAPEGGGEFRWMGTKEGAAYLGITTRTLYRFIDQGALPAYKLGRVIRVKRGDLDTFIEQTRVEPGSLKHLYPPRKDAE
jgi:excisionase family DNA binding protein